MPCVFAAVVGMIRHIVVVYVIMGTLYVVSDLTERVCLFQYAHTKSNATRSLDRRLRRGAFSCLVSFEGTGSTKRIESQSLDIRLRNIHFISARHLSEVDLGFLIPDIVTLLRQ